MARIWLHIKLRSSKITVEIGNWIETNSGQTFDFDDIFSNKIDVNDIAWSLSMQCRYNGHTKRFYSVAEHCCHMSDWVEAQPWSTPLDAFTALHHDDAEFVISDLPRPFKQTLPEFKNVELQIDELISEKFGTIWPFPNWLKQLDTNMLSIEHKEVMNKSTNIWVTDMEMDLPVKLWWFMGRFPAYNRYQWLKRHNRLIGEI